MGVSRGSRAVFALVVIGALLACKKKEAPTETTEPVKTESPNVAKGKALQPVLKTRLGQITAVSKKVKSEPAVKKDQPFKTKLEKTQYFILGAPWLDNPGRPHDENELDLDDTTFFICTNRGEQTEFTDDELKWMQECIDWKYIAVVRPKKVTVPKIKLDSKSFEPGQFDGDLLLFELSTGNIVGRYQMGITNSDKLTYLEGKSEKEWEKESMNDLLENVTGVIEERMSLERDSMGR